MNNGSGLVLFFAIVGAVICSFMAIAKNRNAVGWAIGGALVPVICIIVLAASAALPDPADNPTHTRAGY